MRGWIELCGDLNWIDYYGMWARKARDGAWYVLRWTNLFDAGGKDFVDTPYECEVKYLSFADMSVETIASALRSCGYVVSPDGRSIRQEYDGSVVCNGEYFEACLVECCIGYGLGAPLETFAGKSYPTRIRAEARRYAESCMKDVALREERLSRPVNRIGSTAREYGVGDIDAALHRGPFDIGKNLVRRLHGMVPGDSVTTPGDSVGVATKTSVDGVGDSESVAPAASVVEVGDERK
jgi:hypothetical protein